MAEQKLCGCGKVMFRDRIAAEYFIARVTWQGKERRRERRAYKCERHRWHVTSQGAKGG